MVKGHHKGADFERQVGKLLTVWITGETDGKTQLIRSAGSGGWGDKDWRQVGDLAADGPQGEEFRRVFAVECKHHKEIDFWHIYTTSGPNADHPLIWWEKLAAESEAFGLNPMLIFRANRRPIMVGLHTRIPVKIPSLVRISTANLYEYDQLVNSYTWEHLRKLAVMHGRDDHYTDWARGK